ncbi:hypothetical protein [Halobacterium litoreum]|uniref:Uncharacterized protein n=1 Tax=Halobacterium litoreum TaxID=2039234 RepID=A0ABD5NDG4_9EURY|nr:hypothetical protein [Halobacterium litoreum]UHH13755.1 hypothetical protein LT972_01865 [Halobacterium litoreum]
MTGDGGEGDVTAMVDEMHERASSLDGDAAFEEVFTPGFMQRYTEVESFEAFLAESEWDVSSKADFADVSESEFDEYVAERTRFGDWEEMMGRASEEWMARQMGL